MRLLPSLAAAAALLAAAPAFAASLNADEIFTSVTVQAVSEPHPVHGADGRIHLAYEYFVANPSRMFITLDGVDAVDPSGRILESLKAEALATMTTVYGGTGTTLSPGGTALVFMDVSLAPSSALPASLLARIAATRQSADAGGKPIALAADAPVPASFGFTGAPIGIGKPATVIQSPLDGAGWVVVNGCCNAITSHRGAVMAVNGKLRLPERFAVDWVRLDAEGRLFTGDKTRLASYAYYGAPVHAAAGGTVVNLYDATGEQIPSKPATGINTQNIGGNMVVVDIGGGVFAFYAHLRRGSLKVKLGDSVTAGQVLGLLGNTGNSTAPHLHFHLMDGPSPLNANGLPFELTHFSGRGVVPPGKDDFFDTGAPATIDSRYTGSHGNQLPLNDEVVDFDGR